jgi:hypothetical protein
MKIRMFSAYLLLSMFSAVTVASGAVPEIFDGPLNSTFLLSTNLSATGPTGDAGGPAYNGTLTAPFNLTVTDTSGNAISGALVSGSISDSSGSVFLSSPITNSAGQIQIAVLPGNAVNESITLTVFYNGNLQSLEVPLQSTARTFAVAGGNRYNQGSTYISAQFNAPSGFSGNSFRTTIVPNIGTDGTYYNAGSVLGAYFGLQQCNGSCPQSGAANANRQIIFSTWDNGNNPAQVINAAALNCIKFGTEGTGWSCTQPFNWIVGNSYMFTIQWTQSNNSIDYTLFVQDASAPSNPNLLIGTLRYSGTSQEPTYIIPFVEDFARTTQECGNKPARSMTIKSVEVEQNGSWSPISEAVMGFGIGAGFPYRTNGCGLAYGGPALHSNGWGLISGDPQHETNPFGEVPFGTGDLLNVPGSQ